MSVSGRVAVVTGAGSGIGRAVGNAATEMTDHMAQGTLQADGRMAAEPPFDVRHAASAVLYMASLPLDTNVQFLTITATSMPFIGRG